MKGNTTNQLQPDWSAILDELRQKESLLSDAMLAASLGVTRGYICSVRKGRKGVSLQLAKTIFSKLGKTFEFERIEKLFLPTKVLTHIATLKAVRNHVILRANGHCQLCGMKAPFNSPDGEPYLELHHVNPLKEGGEDSIHNLVALCPNCHRRIDIAPMPDDEKTLKLLVKKYQQ